MRGSARWKPSSAGPDEGGRLTDRNERKEQSNPLEPASGRTCEHLRFMARRGPAFAAAGLLAASAMACFQEPDLDPCKSRLKRYITGLSMYVTDYDERFPRQIDSLRRRVSAVDNRLRVLTARLKRVDKH